MPKVTPADFPLGKNIAMLMIWLVSIETLKFVLVRVLYRLGRL